MFVLCRLLSIATETGVKTREPRNTVAAAAATTLPTPSANKILSPKKRANSVICHEMVALHLAEARAHTAKAGPYHSLHLVRIRAFTPLAAARPLIARVSCQTNSLFVDQTVTNLVDTDSIIERFIAEGHRVHGLLS